MALKQFFYQQPTTITCPLCHQDMEVRFKDIAHEGNSITCPYCHDCFSIKHKPGTKEKIQNIQKALEAFNQELLNK